MTFTAPPLARLYPLLAGMWAVLVLVLTLTPAKQMPEVPEWQLLSFDTAAHAFVFLVLAILTYLAVRYQYRFANLREYAWPSVFLGSVVFGAIIEVLQMTMALGRHGEWSDLISDSLGSATGLLTVWALQRFRK
ncbi:VanZ family protein [Hymenobacter jejuensis]|uniref:VanZ-like domain-containing protein n=1 Tax=Hymenobacter jejuensis TaxID=2502781 RepID=A0A5B7ZZF5_9BACT|nr:VanZ family protein [Hymenobacter jejuensis]QDA60601.1 hypothetical protein FHG12_11025 [Hymenobacter jejuensis]